jgi:hypothetical protein
MNIDVSVSEGRLILSIRHYLDVSPLIALACLPEVLNVNKIESVSLKTYKSNHAGNYIKIKQYEPLLSTN